MEREGGALLLKEVLYSARSYKEGVKLLTPPYVSTVQAYTHVIHSLRSSTSSLSLIHTARNSLPLLPFIWNLLPHAT